MFSSMSRRTALSACAVLFCQGRFASSAQAQTVTDEMKTRWLRDGVPARGAAGAGQIPASQLPLPSALPHDMIPAFIDAGRPVRVEVDHTRLSEFRIQFALDSADLTPAAAIDLRWLGRALQGELRGRNFLLAGHTDITGGLDHNLDLSMRRALAVRDHLVQAYGITPGTLAYAGFGPRYLRTPQRPASGVNRRVEIVAISRMAGL